ncbi:MAG: hypothetical protein KDD73_14595 [Anaerolineales bacterium]|nr:hypothetical protein [Anaerolineales bacterium]MCB9128932.1 hypothetical protein [Ardenticatenales bacterium]
MPSRNYHLFLEDIVIACEKVMVYTHGMDYSDWAQDELLRELLGYSDEKIAALREGGAV